MKHFDSIINQMIEIHKDPHTQYSPAHMFETPMDLSFAVSRLMDAKKIFRSDTLENEEITPQMRDIWFNIRENMPKETAQNIAICIINNTPLSKTSEETDTTKQLFYKVMHDFTDNEQLSNAFTKIFFSNVTKQEIEKRQFKKPKRG